MNPVQELAFEQMRHATFNEFNGEKVVEDLRKYPDIWEACYMTRVGDLIMLRDMPAGYWNIDTLFVLCNGLKSVINLENIAKNWEYDEFDLLPEEEAQSLLGIYGRNLKRYLVRIWWD